MLYCISFSNEIVPVTNYVNIISIKGLNFDNISELNNDVLAGYYLTNDMLVVTGDLFALFVSDRFPRFTIVDSPVCKRSSEGHPTATPFPVTKSKSVITFCTSEPFYDSCGTKLPQKKWIVRRNLTGHNPFCLAPVEMFCIPPSCVVDHTFF